MTETRSCFLHGDYTEKDECPGCASAPVGEKPAQIHPSHQMVTAKHGHRFCFQCGKDGPVKLARPCAMYECRHGVPDGDPCPDCEAMKE